VAKRSPGAANLLPPGRNRQEAGSPGLAAR
jgi:hypothetical protein